MAPSTITIARVLELRVPIAWQEAVEVARRAGAIADARQVPLTLAGCRISTAGTVEIVGVGASASATMSEMQLLAALLEGQSAPPELVALVTAGQDPLSSFPTEDAPAAPAGPSLEWFARPKPEAEIAKLAMRALAADAAAAPPPPMTRQASRIPVHAVDLLHGPDPTRPSSGSVEVARPRPSLVPAPVAAVEPAPPPPPARVALEQLRERVQGQDTGVSAIGAFLRQLRTRFPADLDSSLLRGPAPKLAILGVAALVGVVAASTLFGSDNDSTLRARPFQAPMVLPWGAMEVRSGDPEPAFVARSGGAASSGSSIGVTGPERAGVAGRTETTPPEVRIAPPVAAAIGAPPFAAAGPSIVAERPIPAPPVRDTPVRSGVASAPAPPVDERPLPGASTGVAVDLRIYSEADAGVEPPVWRRPQLPSEPRPDAEQSGSYVEVVVDEHGEVAQVKLRSSDLSLNDRMIVAAVKAWQFQPAMKDGRPVKYRLRVPVTR